MLLTNKRSHKPCISIGMDGHSTGEVQYTGFWQSVDSSNEFKFKFKSVYCYTIQFKLQVTCDVTRYRLQGWDTQTLQWRHNEHDGVSNHQPHDCLLNRLFRHRSKKTSKFRVTGLCEGNSPGTSEFPAWRAGNAENVSIWWRHYDNGVITVAWHRDVINPWWCLWVPRLIQYVYD